MRFELLISFNMYERTYQSLPRNEHPVANHFGVEPFQTTLT